MTLRQVTRRPLIPNFDCYRTVDRLGRQITFYVSNVASQKPLPLSIFVQGSGCDSLFHLGPQGEVRGGYQNLLLRVARNRVRVVAVEKPGVTFLYESDQCGTAKGCPRDFLREHTLPRWAEAVSAAIRACAKLSSVDGNKTLIIGHSEGGITAARIAHENRRVTHLALLASSGPTQLFDLAETARTQGSDAAKERRVLAVYKKFEDILRHPASLSRFAWGHPYRRWSSFLTSSTIDEVLQSRAEVYALHGSKDEVVPVTAFDVLRAELARHGRHASFLRFGGVGHNFAPPGSTSIEGMLRVLSRVVNWFEAGTA